MRKILLYARIKGATHFPRRREEAAQAILNRNVIEPAVSTAKRPSVTNSAEIPIGQSLALSERSRDA